MLAVLLVELFYKCLALAATVWVAHYLTTDYIDALIDFSRTYITIIDLLYSEERLPLRI